MDISFHNEGIRFELKAKIKHKKWIRKWLDSHQFQAREISYVFTSNEQLKLMNKKFLNHNYFTDVISFDYSNGKCISGDVFISIDQLSRMPSCLKLRFHRFCPCLPIVNPDLLSRESMTLSLAIQVKMSWV